MSVDHQLLEVACQRDATQGQFSAGIQDFTWSVGAPNVFFPSKSMRFSLTVTGIGGVVPTLLLAEGCVANMYNNAIFMASGQAVSQINNFFPQASAIERRTSYSLDRIGAYTQRYNGDRRSCCRNFKLSTTLRWGS